MKKKTTAHDIANYILNEQGTMSTMKLQKLVYYCQAWSLVWDEEPLFKEKIEAWANGPVVRELYDNHKGKFTVRKWHWGNFDNLAKKQKETILSVLKYYGDKSSQWLSDLTHKEHPWAHARKGLSPSDRSCKTISHASMAEYYSSL